ncbi:helix-turn-helix domain-containing protein [Burkholderia thailandensis]|uniref:helix-turn-helix domain-containing protein n=2 Tax=Burkholderia thailandensis TaxID=57975 RepID=UPI003D161F12
MPLREVLFGASVDTVVPATRRGGVYSGNIHSHRRDGTGDSLTAAMQLGDALRHRRKELGFTLEQLASKLNVDVGQLSRFERAEFKIVSRNLQKVADFLQIQVGDGVGEPDGIVEQFAELLGRSARHKAAAIALVRALQELR